jgi:pre-mRNA-splicing factor CWC22
VRPLWPIYRHAPRSRPRLSSPSCKEGGISSHGPDRPRASSRSPSPLRNGARAHSPPHQRRRSASPSDLPRVHDVDPARRRERERQLALAALDAESSSKAVTKPSDGGFDAAAEFAKLAAGSRTGGAYVPPARLRQMQLDASKDKASVEFQRLSWDALRKSINGHINKVRRPRRLRSLWVVEGAERGLWC